MKIKYANVCAFRDAELDFPRGNLICIRGETNHGKSSLFYSLVDGFTNSPTFKTYINNEALKENPKATAWIGLYDDEGNVFQVEAGKDHIYYRTNDIKYEKVGRKNIFELSNKQIPGLLYDPEDMRQIMNFQGEDNGLFPIDRPDTQIFKTYERLLSLSSTSDILATIKQDAEDTNIKMSDLLKSAQEYQQKSSAVTQVLQQIDEEKLSNDIEKLKEAIDVYTKLTSYQDFIDKTQAYLDKLRTTPTFEQLPFNVEIVKTAIDALLKAMSIIKYSELSKTVIEKQDYDIQKMLDIAQKYSLALQASEQLEFLRNEIQTDTKELSEVSNKLGSIKVCPLCGKPMGDNDDTTIHNC